VNDGRIDNGASGDLQAPALQMNVHRLQNRSAQAVLLQQMTKLADRRLIGNRLVAEIDLREPPHQWRVVKSFFHRRVRQAEPLLQKVDPHHALNPHRAPSAPGLGIVRPNQRAQRAPRNHLLHLFQKSRAPRLLAVPLKASRHRQCPLCHGIQSLSTQSTHWFCGKQRT